MAEKFQKYQVGGILKIPLGDDWHTYGQMTGDAEVAFFDAKTKVELQMSDIVNRPVLFRLGVYNYAITKFIWHKIGKAALSETLKIPQPMFIQDALHPERFQIYLNGEIRNATREDCIGLEECAVWEPEQVVERINDFYNGVPNKYVRFLT
jgi:Immunity protein 26